MKREETYLSLADRIRSLKEKGRFAEAEEEIQRELKKNPDQPFLKMSLADLCLRQDRLAQARILVEEVLSQDPQHAQALTVLGDLLLKQNSPREALECFRQALAREPRDYLVLKSARALKEMKRFAEALEELEKVLVVKPKNVPFLKEKGLLLNKMKRFGQALEAFEKAKEISPGDSFVHAEILRLRSRERPEGQVVKELQRVVSMESKKDDAQMHGLLGQKLKEAGQVREAAAEYRMASSLDPRNLFFLKQEGFCHNRDKNYEEALRCLGEALRRDPADSV
ncbi:MAG: tetratricopeptide repeat protein, partial [Deltaproteobacteria bacterium]|nr:tetratricopeptide repeat protein [Deltaproteobacteria bacterium]